MKKLINITLVILLFLAKPIYSQNIDSLKLSLKNAKHDTVLCNILNQLAETASDEEWPEFNNQLLNLTERKLKITPKTTKDYRIYQIYMANALNNNGYLADIQGDVQKALEFYTKSLKLRETIGDKPGLAYSLNNLGGIYRNQGDIPKALDYWSRSLKIQEEIGDKRGWAGLLNNIGYLYQSQGDISKALEYHNKSLQLKEDIDDKNGIANSLNNIGLIFHNQGNVLKALDYYNRSLQIKKQLGDKRGIAASLNNIGTTYDDIGNYSKALEYFVMSLKLQEEFGDKEGVSNSLNNIGGLFFKQKNYSRALEYCSQSLELSMVIGYPESIRNAAEDLSKVYRVIGNYKLALENYELFIQMRDSINNETTQKASIQKQFQYEYEKKAAADSVANAKANEIRDAQIAQQKAEIKAKRNQQLALYGGLVLLLVFAGFMYNRFKITQNQKVEIELAHHQLEEKNAEIIASIRYAKRIQDSLLTSQKYIARNIERLKATKT